VGSGALVVTVGGRGKRAAVEHSLEALLPSAADFKAFRAAIWGGSRGARRGTVVVRQYANRVVRHSLPRVAHRQARHRDHPRVLGSKAQWHRPRGNVRVMGDARVHPAAASGYASAADEYERGRPDYPGAIADWLRDDVGLGSEKRVLDLGAGTGKFTPRLVGTGAEVIAVEPVAAMLAKLSSALPTVEARCGTAEAIPLPNESVDAVVCAQAFHWFATPRALAEIRRVLRPDGVLGLVWNARDESVDWVARLTNIVDVHEGSAPRFRSGAWQRVFPFERLSPLEERRFAHVHAGSPEDVVVNRIRSVSFIAALPEALREGVIREVRALIASEPALAGRDLVELPYVTHAYLTRRVSI